MKKNFLLSILFFIALGSIAQPSDEQIKQDLVAKGALAVKFFSEKGTVHTTLTEKYYLRTVEAKWKTDYKGIFSWSRSDYRYDFKGGKWTFTRSYFSDSWYEGIPNPTNAEVLKLVEDNIETYFMGSGERIGKHESIKVADKPQWTWESLKSASCKTEVVYTRKVDEIGNAEKIKEVRRVKMFKDADDKNSPFVRIIAYKEGEPEVLQQVKYKTDDEESPFKSSGNSQSGNGDNDSESAKEPVYEKFQINDAVTVNWNGQGKDFYKGKVVKLDSFDKNRYFVEFETIQSAWIHAKFMTKR